MHEYLDKQRKKNVSDPKTYGPRVISDKEEQEIIESTNYKPLAKPRVADNEADDPPNKIIPSLSQLTETTATTTTRPKVRDILEGTGVQ